MLQYLCFSVALFNLRFPIIFISWCGRRATLAELFCLRINTFEAAWEATEEWISFVEDLTAREFWTCPRLMVWSSACATRRYSTGLHELGVMRLCGFRIGHGLETLQWEMEHAITLTRCFVLPFIATQSRAGCTALVPNAPSAPGVGRSSASIRCEAISNFLRLPCKRSASGPAPLQSRSIHPISGPCCSASASSIVAEEKIEFEDNKQHTNEGIMHVLFLSNGHGEDTIAVSVLKELMVSLHTVFLFMLSDDFFVIFRTLSEVYDLTVM